MKTLIRISQEDDDGNVYNVDYYEREGEWEVQTQLTSWMRECAIDYWKNLTETEKA